MAEFEVKVYRAQIEEHPFADAIELMRIGDYRSVVQKGQFRNGDLVAYIPEQSIMPDWLLEKMNLKGKLAGPDCNRIRAVRLRGIVSEGLVYPMPDTEEGDDVTDLLGVTKYIPMVPPELQGNVYHAPGQTVHYDIENVKKYPDSLVEGEEVVITEKIHGTQCQIGYYRDEPIVTSKLYGAHNQALNIDGSNDKNIYVKVARKYQEDLTHIYHELQNRTDGPHTSFYLVGEIFGQGVQDLSYDSPEKQFRVFDVYLGEHRHGRFLDYQEMIDLLDGRMDTAPLVYQGPYSREKLVEVTEGPSLIASHGREGVVIKTAKERADLRLERIILKSVSEKHQLRKGVTTEYQ